MPSDNRLARRAANGDRRAFAAIYERYHQELYRFCMAITRDSHDAQDALQNTMLKALRALPGERREIRLKPWLYRIAHNEAIETIRRRRDDEPLESAARAGSGEVAVAVESRDRLRALLADLGELPDRQRAALVMRELGDLGFDEIGQAFESSPAVARQTVYEARLSLRQMEEGREMSCDRVRWELSSADGRISRRRDLRAHLRACPECRAFQASIGERRRDLAALAPLPAVASAGILHGVLGSASGAGGAGGLAGTGTAVGTAAGKAVAGPVLVKTLAAAAVVAVGVTAADRSGVIDTPIPGGGGGSAVSSRSHGGAGGAGGSGIEAPAGAAVGSGGNAGTQGGTAPGGSSGGGSRSAGTAGNSHGGQAGGPASEGSRGPASGEGNPGGEGEAGAGGQGRGQGHGSGAAHGATHGGGHAASGSHGGSAHGANGAHGATHGAHGATHGGGGHAGSTGNGHSPPHPNGGSGSESRHSNGGAEVHHGGSGQAGGGRSGEPDHSSSQGGAAPITPDNGTGAPLQPPNREPSPGAEAAR